MAWELIKNEVKGETGNAVRRLAVPGGWIYQTLNMRGYIVFVPEPNKVTAEHDASELDIAYKQGYDAAVKEFASAPQDQADWERGYKTGWKHGQAERPVVLDQRGPNVAVQRKRNADITVGYPKYIVVLTDYDGEAIMATHRLFATPADADASLTTVHPKMKPVVVMLDKPLYVREGES